jgi:hypothetical protein
VKAVDKMPRIRQVLMIRPIKKIDEATRQPVRKEELREYLLLVSNQGDFRPLRVIRCKACNMFTDWSKSKCECGADRPEGDPTTIWKSSPVLPPRPPDDPYATLEEFLRDWRVLIEREEERLKTIDLTTRGARTVLIEIKESRATFEETIDAYGRSDLAVAADRINYARSRGWKLPEIKR